MPDRISAPVPAGRPFEQKVLPVLTRRMQNGMQITPYDRQRRLGSVAEAPLPVSGFI